MSSYIGLEIVSIAAGHPQIRHDHAARGDEALKFNVHLGWWRQDLPEQKRLIVDSELQDNAHAAR